MRFKESRDTKEWRGLARLVNRFIQSSGCPLRDQYLNVTVQQNVTTSEHQDKNAGSSAIVSFGDFKKGLSPLPMLHLTIWAA